MILLKNDKVKPAGSLSIWVYLIFFIFSFGCSPEEGIYAIIISEDANFRKTCSERNRSLSEDPVRESTLYCREFGVQKFNKKNLLISSNKAMEEVP